MAYAFYADSEFMERDRLLPLLLLLLAVGAVIVKCLYNTINPAY